MLPLAYIILAARHGCHCVYHSVLPKGRSMFPSALAPSALVPNAIIVARLSLLSHSKMQPL